ncbi:hypothetical protein Ga0100230_010790 [Opitutaceae bacterium TAV3]|nr:hypothetical protein Ga0100230_010790 [Opitutaceae bacterium TAV3]
MSWPEDAQRGVNSGTWLKSHDMAVLAKWGTKIIRAELVGNLYKPVQVDGEWTLPEGGWKALNAFLDAAKTHDLKVVIDYHDRKFIFPDARYPTWSQEPGAPGIANKDKLVSLWKSIATRYKDERGTIIAYEILNEPHPAVTKNKPNGQPPLDGADAWNTILTEVVTAIRQIDTYHNIIIEPVGYANHSYLPRLVHFDPAQVPGIIYSVHIYSPHEFMEQGSKIAREWKYGFDNASGYYYPGMFDRVSYNPIRYTPTLLDKAYLKTVTDRLREFQKTHPNARLFIGEFGTKRWAPLNLEGEDSTWAIMRDYMQLFTSADIPGVKHPHWDWALHAYRMAANDAYTGLEYSNDKNDNKRYPDTNRIRLYKHYLDPRNDNTPPPAYDRTLPDARVPQTTPSPPPPPLRLVCCFRQKPIHQNHLGSHARHSKLLHQTSPFRNRSLRNLRRNPSHQTAIPDGPHRHDHLFRHEVFLRGHSIKPPRRKPPQQSHHPKRQLTPKWCPKCGAGVSPAVGASLATPAHAIRCHILHTRASQAKPLRPQRNLTQTPPARATFAATKPHQDHAYWTNPVSHKAPLPFPRPAQSPSPAE